MKYKWFWLTLLTWFVLGGISTWALIYSPFQLFPRKVSRFNVEVNGSIQKYELYELPNSLEDCLAGTTELWSKEGWMCRTGNINFANMLLGLKSDCSLLSTYLYISLFQKKDLFRVLGLWRNYDNTRTYQCIAEIPKKCFETGAGMAWWDFPISPPPDAFQPCCARFGDFQTAIWFQPSGQNLENKFIELFSNQGYEGKLWVKNDFETVYLLRKGKFRLLALLKSGERKDVISFLNLNKH